MSVGASAPDFQLSRKIGEPPFRLSDQRGKPVVVLFFPLAFSGVCTKEICQVRDEWDLWRELDAVVVAISVDSAFTNHRFAQETKAPFPVLSDFNREACTAYGVRNDDYFGMRGVAQRSAFVVDA
ncbi:MAG: redoxin domain-containing protein, partial [Gemmatimonadetes bacterium]|nr:redoxin domain-containing protein [Gemmatimonadota bacterium]